MLAMFDEMASEFYMILIIFASILTLFVLMLAMFVEIES